MCSNNNNLIVNDYVMMIIAIAQYQYHRRCGSVLRYMTLLDIACITCLSTAAVTLLTILTCFVVSGDVFMCNNANFHARMLELIAWLKQHAITIIYLLTYSPELNPCEMVFGFVKNSLRSVMQLAQHVLRRGERALQSDHHTHLFCTALNSEIIRLILMIKMIRMKIMMGMKIMMKISLVGT